MIRLVVVNGPAKTKLPVFYSQWTTVLPLIFILYHQRGPFWGSYPGVQIPSRKGRFILSQFTNGGTLITFPCSKIPVFPRTYIKNEII